MSALSKKDLIKRLNTKNLVVSPILDKKQLGPCSIDLRLGNVAFIAKAKGLSHVDPKSYAQRKEPTDHKIEQDRRQKFERYEIPFRDTLLLHPGMLYLVPTLEWVRLPDDLQGIVTARSSWAREGLNIATATFINPCYTGIITLELANLGQIPIALHPGLRIAQMALYEVTGKAEPSMPSQFNLSFEPRGGEIIAGDEVFVPLG